MPRSARIDLPGLLQHVMMRGIERRDIFLDDEDRSRFLGRFSRLLRESGAICYAWALLPNHVHLLLKPTSYSLARLMRRLLTGYAGDFNRRHQRVGHLFQNRYKSLVCEDESYLLELVRYIHLNPLRAGLVVNLDELSVYPWCGHGVLLGKNYLPEQEVDEVLQRFGRNPVSARSNYLQFVADGVAAGPQPELSSKRCPLGGERRAGDLPAGFDGMSGGRESRLTLHHVAGVENPVKLPLAALLQRVSAYYQVEPDVVRQPGRLRRIAEVRAVVCYVGVRLFGYPGQEVGRMLSLASSAGVTIAAGRGEKIWRAHYDLQKWITVDRLESWKAASQVEEL